MAATATLVDHPWISRLPASWYPAELRSRIPPLRVPDQSIAGLPTNRGVGREDRE